MSLGILLSLLQPPFEGIINKACESLAPASYYTFVENRYKRGHQYFLGYVSRTTTVHDCLYDWRKRKTGPTRTFGGKTNGRCITVENIVKSCANKFTPD